MNWIEKLQKIREERKSSLVVGMGISGVETASFLLSIGIVPICIEKQDQQTFKAKSKFFGETEILISQGAQVHFGIDGEKVSPLLADVGLAVLSPGVGLETAIVGALERNKIEIVSELELAVQVHQGPTVVVTGSVGKSTTTALIAHLLNTAGKQSVLCASVGVPVIASPHLLASFDGKASPDLPVLAVEASSYQLESCSVIKPNIAVFLNLAENHLERHGNMERYGAAKARVLKNQDSSDMLICNYDDKRVLELGRSGRAKLALFGTASLAELTKITKWCASVKTNSEGGVIIELSLESEIETYDTAGALLLGRHNRLNMAAALLACRRLGISKTHLEKSLLSFAPLEHRIEKLSLPSGLVVINDSKATTVAASVAALTSVLESFPGKKIKLLLGGLSKAGSWDPLFSMLYKNKECIAQVVCFGKDGPLISSLARGQKIETCIAEKMRDAVAIGCADMDVTRVLLFSPGCASFDEFADFEERGRVFKELVVGRLT